MLNRKRDRERDKKTYKDGGERESMVAGKSEREKERETHTICLNQVKVKLKFQWNVILYQGKGFQTISNIHVIDYN